jgi:cytochrome c-type biogenesis protein CcmH/NrfF
MLYKQQLKIMLITVATFIFLLISLILGNGNAVEPIPTPQATYYDTEKEQLTAQLQVLKEENIRLQDSNTRLKWYMDTFYTPAQVEYMRRVKK